MATDQPTRFGGIYAIRHKDSGKLYVGSAVNIFQRWRQHRSDLRKHKHGNGRLQAAWNKYGPDAFAWEILESVTNKKDLVPTEQRYLDDFEPWRAENGYNNSPTAGSNLGMKFGPLSPDHRAKISALHTGAIFTPERRARISAAKMGHGFSDESLAKMSATRKGRPGKPHTDQARAKVSAARKGKPLSEEHRAKLSEAHRGKPLSPEHRAKMSAAHKAKVPHPNSLANLKLGNRDRMKRATFAGQLSFDFGDDTGS